jgi:energy-coupling factor transporter ATP-binding protein EcfA2
LLTKLTVRNFKRFGQVEIELGNPVVFFGPNDSGKTTALQALALWDIGVKRWNERRKGKVAPETRPGVTINRRDLIAVPIANANLLWHDLRVRDVRRVDGRQETKNIRVDIIVEGVTEGKAWECGLEFDYANEESFYCRPLRLSEGKNRDRMAVPEEVGKVLVAFLPPMSGLAANEKLQVPGAINVLLGEGRTAEVLRNLCYQILIGEDGARNWGRVCDRISSLFNVRLDEPKFIPERGEIVMTYRTRSKVRLDLSSSGRGLQQTLLLLAHLMVNPGYVLLLDEPDAHLEILRQRQIYQLLTEEAQRHGSQIIAASHSEIILNEAADRNVVVAFVGKPHRIDDRGTQVLKSIKEIGFQDYSQAEQTGWVLYLEGSTDLAILRAFAETLGHPARAMLARPFVHYVGNQPNKAREHFYGLREAKPDLVGFALFDHLDQSLPQGAGLQERMWTRREIENYLCQPETLLAYAGASGPDTGFGPLWDTAESERRRQAMQRSISDSVPPAALRDPSDPYWVSTKASDEFLGRVFAAFFTSLNLPNLMRKTGYHLLAQHVPQELIDAEVRDVLDAIVAVAEAAHPVGDDQEER